MKRIIIFGLTIIILLSCKKDNKTDDSDFVDSFDLIGGNCYSSLEQCTICFDTVLTDSRCATGELCYWEGNATIKLDLTTRDSESYKVELNTNPDFTIDTTIGNIYILLTDLTPYPDINMEINPKDYKAKLTIANIDKIESNAKIINFNPEKCGCCWGWTIIIGNDTIKSDNEIIGKKLGYKTDFPVNVYIEKGELEQTCSEIGGYDYYGLNQMIKIE